jgi:hypothetical protein
LKRRSGVSVRLPAVPAVPAVPAQILIGRIGRCIRYHGGTRKACPTWRTTLSACLVAPSLFDGTCYIACPGKPFWPPGGVRIAGPHGYCAATFSAVRVLHAHGWRCTCPWCKCAQAGHPQREGEIPSGRQPYEVEKAVYLHANAHTSLKPHSGCVLALA